MRPSYFYNGNSYTGNVERIPGARYKDVVLSV